MHLDRRALGRFFAKIRVVSSGCWEWAAAFNGSGYGSFWCHLSEVNTSAHRVAFAWFVRPVDGAEVVDHLCRNIRCVNPAHLEAVPQAVNVARGVGVLPRESCKRGHELTPSNVFMQTNYGKSVRTCLKCRQLREARRRLRRHNAKLGGGVVHVRVEFEKVG